MDQFLNGTHDRERDPARRFCAAVLLNVIANCGEIVDCSIGPADLHLPGIPLVDQVLDFIVLDQFSAISRSDALLDFTQKPAVEIDQAFYRLHDEGLTGTSLLTSEAVEFWPAGPG